jgi:hypothetical protein
LQRWIGAIYQRQIAVQKAADLRQGQHIGVFAAQRLEDLALQEGVGTAVDNIIAGAHLRQSCATGNGLANRFFEIQKLDIQLRQGPLSVV